jgi:hypothetical protein
VASKVKLRIVLDAPVKAGLAVELALAFEALKTISVLLPKVTVLLQFVEVPKLPEVAPVQVCARAGGTRTAPAASASKTAMRTRRTEVNGGLEFIWGGMNGRQIRKRKRASTPEKLGIPRRTKIPSPPAEQVAKRRNRRAFDGEMGNHGDVKMEESGLLKKVL